MQARTILSGGAIVLAAGILAIAGFLWLQPPPPAAARPTVVTATAEVTRGTLVDTKTVTGTLGYGELSSLRPHLTSASAMVTWLAPVDSTVQRGEPLYRLDGQPAILFYGSAPQHRTLRFDRDAASPVWVELEEAEAAVEAGELSLRLEQARLADAEARIVDTTTRLNDALAPAPSTPDFVQLTGAVHTAEAKLKRVEELSAAQLTPAAEVATAEAELATARATIDSAVRGLRKDLATAELDVVTARLAVTEAKVKLDELRTTSDDLTARAADNTDVAQIADNLTALGYTGPLADQVRAWQRAAGLPVTGIVGPAQLVVAPGPVHIAAQRASVGQTLVASSPDNSSILDYSSIEKLVTVALGVGDRRLAALGRTVTVTLPDDSKVKGTISEVGSVVTDGNIEVTVTIADQRALGELDVAAVDVEFVSSSRDDVLSVPITALLASPSGGFAVEVVHGGQSTIVPVHTGLFGSGRVEITGDGIAEGMQVGVPG